MSMGSRLHVLAAGIAAALTAASAGANQSDDATTTNWLREVIVTAPRMQAPLVLEMDAKAPRQPLPAHDGADYLKTVPGFAVIRKGGTDGDPVFRGMAASRVNLLLDGEQILGGCGMRMDPPTAYVFPESFDRIVVIKGPQTVLHGPGNSAATVLFERTEPRFDAGAWRVHSSALAASAGRTDVVGDVQAGNERIYGQFSGTRAQADDYEDGAGDTVHSAYDRWSANALVGWTPDADTRIVFSGARSDGEASYADRAMDGVQFDRENLGLRFERSNLSAIVRQLDVQAYYNYVDHVMDNYTLRAFAPSMMMPNRAVSNPDRQTSGGRASVELAMASGIDATIGLDTQRNVHTVRSTMNQTMLPFEALRRVEDAWFRNTGVFGEAIWPAAEAQRIVAGVRLDRWEAQDSRATVSTGMGAMTMPNPTAGARRSTTLTSGFARRERDLSERPATIYAGVGHVERFPDYWEILAAGRESAASLSAFDTRPERTTQLDTGLIWRSQRMAFSLAGFYNRIDDYILIQSGYPKGMRTTTIARNIDATTYGAEVDAAYALADAWRLTGTLACTRGTNDTDDRPLGQIAPLELRVGLEYERNEWSVGLLARAVADQERFAVNQGNVVGQDLGRTDGFATLSFNAAWRPLAGVLVSAGVDNLFDRLYAEHLSRSGAMVAGFAQTTRVNEPGRTAWLKVSADFR